MTAAPWRVAKSLEVLLAEVNARFPHRSKASDGSIGDAAHATRDSDHNPWVKDGTMGVVTARDFTEDDAPGVPEIADLIVRTLVARRDPRVKYLIHEAKIWRSYNKPGIPAWTAAEYSGPNGHFKHVHVSVLPDKALYDNTLGWGIYPHHYTRLPLRRGADNPDVWAAQARLITLGFLPLKNDAGKSNVDGAFGPITEAATRRAQTAHRQHPTGVFDQALEQALR